MKSLCWAVVPLVLLATAAETQAQSLIGSNIFAGFRYGSGFGFSYRNGRLSIGGFIGSPVYNRYASSSILVAPVVIPYAPIYAPPPTPPYPPPLVPMPYNGGVLYDSRYPAPLYARPPYADETAGIDLDLVPPKSKTNSITPPGAKTTEDLPGGKVVSKPVAPPAPKTIPPKKTPPVQAPAPQAPVDLSTMLLDEGVRDFQSQEYGLAAHRFRQASFLDLKLARAHFLLAQAQFALGKFAPAVEAIHAGMDLEKQWPKAKFRPRLDLYAGAGEEFDTHVQRLESALKQSPDSPTLLFLLAYQHWFDDKQAAAVTLFRRARLTAPNPVYVDQFLLAAGPAIVAGK